MHALLHRHSAALRFHPDQAYAGDFTLASFPSTNKGVSKDPSRGLSVRRITFEPVLVQGLAKDEDRLEIRSALEALQSLGKQESIVGVSPLSTCWMQPSRTQATGIILALAHYALGEFERTRDLLAATIQQRLSSAATAQGHLIDLLVLSWYLQGAAVCICQHCNGADVCVSVSRRRLPRTRARQARCCVILYRSARSSQSLSEVCGGLY